MFFIYSDEDFDETGAGDIRDYDDTFNPHALDQVVKIESESDNSDPLSLLDKLASDDDFDNVLSSQSDFITACDYGSSNLAQPFLVVAAALVLLVIEKNMSATALDSVMSVIMVSYYVPDTY